MGSKKVTWKVKTKATPMGPNKQLNGIGDKTPDSSLVPTYHPPNPESFLQNFERLKSFLITLHFPILPVFGFRTNSKLSLSRQHTPHVNGQASSTSLLLLHRLFLLDSVSPTHVHVWFVMP